MHQNKISLEALLKKSENVTFSAQSIKGVFRLEGISDVSLVRQFENGEIPNLSFQTEVLNYVKGDKLPYTIALHHTGKQYASYQSYIQHSLKAVNNFTPSENILIYEEIYNQYSNTDQKSKIEPLNSIIFFIGCLAKQYYYRDNQIIIFAKNHCEIPVQHNSFEKYLDIALSYINSDQLLDSLQKFTDWLSSSYDSTDYDLSKSLAVHENERYTIAASEFVDNLNSIDKGDRVFHILKNIDIIYQSTLSKYSLYLDDFKYSRFNDKIAKYADDFLIKVNKTISELQTQILAIPLSVAILGTLKPDTKLNQFIFLAFLIYSIMVFYATAQQTYNLNLISSQIKNFISDNKIPDSLSGKWNTEITPIENKIFWHRVYLICVFLFVDLVIWLCTYKLTNQLYLIF